MIDHDTCSELLRPYLMGGLAAPENRAVEEHLASCEQCEQELRGLTVLSSIEAPGLAEFESARLHREVWSKVGTRRREPQPSLGARIAPLLGAAALFVVLAVATVGAFGLLGGSDDDSGDAGVSNEMDSGDGDAGGGGDAGRDEPSGSAAGGSADYDEGSEAMMESAAGPVFRKNQGAFTDESLDDLGSNGKAFKEIATQYSVDDARREQMAFIDQLGTLSGRFKTVVVTCGRRAIREIGPSALAAYGATGTYDGRRSLILGFAASSSGAQLDRYSIWVYPTTNCDLLTRREGPLEP